MTLKELSVEVEKMLEGSPDWADKEVNIAVSIKECIEQGLPCICTVPVKMFGQSPCIPSIEDEASLCDGWKIVIVPEKEVICL